MGGNLSDGSLPYSSKFVPPSVDSSAFWVEANGRLKKPQSEAHCCGLDRFLSEFRVVGGS